MSVVIITEDTTGQQQELIYNGEITIDNVQNAMVSSVSALSLVSLFQTGGALTFASASMILDGIGTGFLLSTTASAGYGSVQTAGLLSGFSGLTPGATYYASAATRGAITSSIPTGDNQTIQSVGVAINSTTLLINIQTLTVKRLSTNVNRLVFYNPTNVQELVQSDLQYDSTNKAVSVSNSYSAGALISASNTNATSGDALSGTANAGNGVTGTGTNGTGVSGTSGGSGANSGVSATNTSSGRGLTASSSTGIGIYATTSSSSNPAIQANVSLSTYKAIQSDGYINSVGGYWYNNKPERGNWADRPGASGGAYSGLTPATHDIWEATDRDTKYFYNGSAWVTAQVYSVQLVSREVMPVTQGTHAWEGVLADLGPNSGYYFLNLVREFLMNVAQSSSTYYTWSMALQGGTGILTFSAPPDTKTVTTTALTTLNSTYNIANTGTSKFLQLTSAVGGGSPGSFYLWSSFNYRMLG